MPISNRKSSLTTLCHNTFIRFEAEALYKYNETQTKLYDGNDTYTHAHIIIY